MFSPVEPKLLPTSSSRKSRIAEKGYLFTDTNIVSGHVYLQNTLVRLLAIGVLPVGKTSTSRTEHLYIDMNTYIWNRRLPRW